MHSLSRCKTVNVLVVKAWKTWYSGKRMVVHGDNWRDLWKATQKRGCVVTAAPDFIHTQHHGNLPHQPLRQIFAFSSWSLGCEMQARKIYSIFLSHLSNTPITLQPLLFLFFTLAITTQIPRIKMQRGYFQVSLLRVQPNFTRIKLRVNIAGSPDQCLVLRSSSKCSLLWEISNPQFQHWNTIVHLWNLCAIENRHRG